MSQPVPRFEWEYSHRTRMHYCQWINQHRYATEIGYVKRKWGCPGTYAWVITLVRTSENVPRFYGEATLRTAKRSLEGTFTRERDNLVLI